MQIRQLTPDDAESYQNLRLFALRESPTAFGSSYAEMADRPLEMFAERLGDERNHIFGAFTDDRQLVGIATLRREQREKIGHKASIFGMYVLPEYRGQGLGRSLLEKLISRAGDLGVRQVNLSVVSANTPAVLLYESCGFERFGLERDAFRIGDDFYDVAYMALQPKYGDIVLG